MDNIKILKKENWKNHPWSINNYVFNTKIEFLKSISNPNATKYTDLLNESIVHQDIVWEDIKKNGMQEPLLIVIGYKDKTIRLESGNHRVNTAISDNYTHLPCAFFVFKESVFAKGNGEHKFDAKGLIDFSKLIKCPYPYQINPKIILPTELFI